MPLPLLGLLAAAGVAAASGKVGESFLDEMMSKREGKRASGALEGVDGSDPQASSRALMGAGLLGADDFSSGVSNRFDNLASRQQSDRNSRRSAGTSAANNQRSNDAAMARLLQAQEFQTSQAERASAMIEATSGGRGAGWMAMDGGDRMESGQLATAITDLTSVADFVNRTSWADRNLTAGMQQETAEMMAKFNTTMLPALAKMAGAGAMQKEELELFREWGGDPFKFGQMTNSEYGKLVGVINRLKGEYTNHSAAYQYQPVPFGQTHSMKPYKVPDAEEVANRVYTPAEIEAQTEAALARLVDGGGHPFND